MRPRESPRTSSSQAGSLQKKSSSQMEDVVGVEAPQELSNEKMQAERILGERTVYKKGRKTGPMVRLALDKSLTNDEAYTLQVNDKGYND